MTSINTNISAMAALATLRSINQEMETTQNRISSGYRVETAGDNAAYWSIATTMRSDNKALSAVKDALGLGAATVDVAYTAMEASIKVVDEIKAKMVAASEPGVDKDKIDKEIKQLQDQLLSIAKSASFSGQNWVYDTATAAGVGKEIVGSFNRDGSDNVSLTTLTFDTTNSLLIAIGSDGAVDTTGGLLSENNADFGDDKSLLTLTTKDLAGADLGKAIQAVDGILQKMTDAASDLGALNSRIKLQENFVEDLSDSIEKGIGRLVDADMNEESTRLKALQTQQQLGIQALSIANSNSQNVLQLFR